MESSKAGRKSKWEITIERMRRSLTRSTAKHKENDCSNQGGVDQGTKIDALPDDILIEIIKLLPVAQWPSLEGVNHRFQRATFGAWGSLRKIRLADDLIIARKEIREDPVKTFDSILGKLVLRAPNVTELSGFSIFSFLMASPMFCDSSIQSLAQFDNLRSITFEHGGIRLAELTNFLETSSSRGQLRELKVVSRVLFHCGYDEELKQRNENLLASAFGPATNRPQLKLEKLVLYTMHMNTFLFLATMDVSRLTTFKVKHTHIDAADLITLLSRATNIENLKFNFCGVRHINNDCLHLAVNKEVLKIIGTSETLLSLNIDGYFGWDSDGCFDVCSHMVEMITKLGHRCRLEKLSLLHHLLCTEEVILAIANNMASLKSLKLHINRDYTEESLVQVVTNLVRLEKLLLNHTTRKIISTAAANLMELKYFDVGIESNESTAMIFEDLGASVSLKELHMRIGIDINMATIKKWSEGVGLYLEALVLNFEGMANATAQVISKGLMIIVKKFPGLRLLNLQGTNVTDSCLHAIASSLPDLHELDLSHCMKITTKGVQGIVDGCLRLKRLRMEGHGDLFRAKMKLKKYSTIYKD